MEPANDNGIVQSIAVFRALQLGDMLCAVPALRALRAAWPQAHITLIGLPWARSFVDRYGDYLDDLMCFPGLPGMPEQSPDEKSLSAFFDAAQARDFDWAIQMHGSGLLTNEVVGKLGARRIGGFHPADRENPDPTSFLAWDDGEHEVSRALRLVELIGAPSRGDHLEFPLREEDADELLQLLQGGIDVPPPGTYVCVHPGARMRTRRWPVERFAEVADCLARMGFRIVLTGAPDEAELTQGVRQRMSTPALDLAGKTGLGALALLISRARLVVCNDTGISHVTAAVGTPSVVICSGADPGRWAPLDSDRHRVLSHPVECRPCMHMDCPVGHGCALGVGAATVLEVACCLLGMRSDWHRPFPAVPTRWPNASHIEYRNRSLPL